MAALVEACVAPPGEPPAAPGYALRPVRRWREGRFAGGQDCIVEEVPVALLYNGEPYAVMMATPRDLEDFARGFSLSEAVIAHAGELAAIQVQPRLEGIELQLSIPPARAQALAARQRGIAGRSGCGICGARLLEDVVRQPARVGAAPAIAAPVLHAALARLGEGQALNAATGAAHAAAWVHVDGHIALLREDVGRHNALDKLIGAMATRGENPGAGFVLLTSRASFEMVQKAATAGIAYVAAISAPTALAIQVADAAGVTLVGFARGDSHIVYAQAPHGRVAPVEGAS